MAWLSAYWRDMMKCGIVAVIGRPNAGKSSLINRILEQKVVIVSDKPQTSWHKIRCVYSDDQTQIVFVDTPGIHKPLNALGSYMMKAAQSALTECDHLLWVIDGMRAFSKEDQNIMSLLQDQPIAYDCVINKIDLISMAQQEDLHQKILSMYSPRAVHHTSAHRGDGIQTLLEAIKGRLMEGEPFYDPEMIVDRPSRFMAAELIREKIFLHTQKEIPYSSGVVIEHFEEKNHVIHVRAEIYVLRQNQKGILIGKEGSRLKQIGTEARKDLEYLLDRQVYLEIFVKVKEKWREKAYVLQKEMEYRQD